MTALCMCATKYLSNFSEIEKLQEELVDSEAILDGKRKVDSSISSKRTIEEP